MVFVENAMYDDFSCLVKLLFLVYLRQCNTRIRRTNANEKNDVSALPCPIPFVVLVEMDMHCASGTGNFDAR